MNKTKRLVVRVTALVFAAVIFVTATSQVQSSKLQDQRAYEASVYILPTLILEHANVVNPLNEQPLLDQTIVLNEGKIQSVSSGPAQVPGEKIDLKGAWVLPGLIDAHIHPTNIAAAHSMLSCGVTTGRSMFALNYADVGLRALHNRGGLSENLGRQGRAQAGPGR